VSIKQRTDDWNQFDDAWDPLRMKYAWAVPDDRALNILAEFSPLVEIGAGKGYWAALLSNMDVDIVCFDAYPEKELSWTKVHRGGPEKLRDARLADRSLFLCYPDEQESIAIECLENFKGQYIIHVGELAVVGTLGEAPQTPFGRTSSAEFQVVLLQSFHCLLVAELQVQLPFGKDCITIWKRTKYVLGRRFDNNLSVDSEEEDNDDEEDDNDDEDDEDVGDEDEEVNVGSGAFIGSMSIEELDKLRGSTATSDSG
jgi:hypothetical protein